MRAILDVSTPRDERRRPNDLHLRAVLERLPVAVLRIDVNGGLMAVNQAGLGLLGGTSLKDVLGTSFLSYLDDAQREPCARLFEEAGEGLGGSLEIDLRGLTGTPHLLEIHAVPHPGAPDATPSVMVTLRDVTRARQLSQALEDAAARQSDADSRLQIALQDLQQKQSRHEALVSERQQSQEQGESELADLRQRLTTAADETTRAVARAGDLERALDDARRAHESRAGELQEHIDALERSHAAALESARAELTRERSARDEAHATRCAELTAAHEARCAELVSMHEARCAELTAAHDARLTELANTRGAHLAEAESALAAALAGQRSAEVALEQAETGFIAERQRLEAETATARDAERAAQAAWTTEQSERLRADVGRQHLVDAIARLAREAGIIGRTDLAEPADSGGRTPNGHDVPERDGNDTPQTSAW